MRAVTQPTPRRVANKKRSGRQGPSIEIAIREIETEQALGSASASGISSELSSKLSAEIIIVGAGLAGTALAAVLGRQGRRVILVDLHASCPPLFRAEKIEKEQVLLLRKLGLLEHLLPYCGRVREVWGSYDGRIFKTSPIEQYGLKYAEMVNALRAEMPAEVVSRVGRVESITNSDEVQRVKLVGGEELSAKLVVLACGSRGDFQNNLGMRRRVVQKDQSLGFGFDIAADSQAFPFDALTYYSMSPSARIDYLTLFKFRNTMRANLFVFRSASDPWVREFIQKPEAMLRRHLPKLSRVTGEFRVTSNVESSRVDLYKVDCDPQPGVVLIGDASQSACPATGMGLDKVLTDVDVLAECVPQWLATPGMSAEKMAGFYQHPRKLGMDGRALQRAQEHRRVVVDPSLRWRVHRFLLHTKWQMLATSMQLRNAREAFGSRAGLLWGTSDNS
jgi:2-polyprenyl-6-methoxyphenol hydroxylase-like FAD-dependent oxidoreductase